MTKLEKAIADLEVNLPQQMKPRKMTEAQRCKMNLDMLINAHETKIELLKAQIASENMAIESIKRKRHIASTGGYLSIFPEKVDKFVIESGFTAIEEILPELVKETLGVVFTTVKPNPMFNGVQVYKIANNGIVTLIEITKDKRF